MEEESTSRSSHKLSNQAGQRADEEGKTVVEGVMHGTNVRTYQGDHATLRIQTPKWI